MHLKTLTGYSVSSSHLLLRGGRLKSRAGTRGSDAAVGWTRVPLTGCCVAASVMRKPRGQLAQGA